MKYLLISLLIATSCKSQTATMRRIKNDTIIPKSSTMYYIPNVDSSFEKFNFQNTKEGYLKEQNKQGQIPNANARQNTYRYEEDISDRTVLRIYSEVRNKEDKRLFGESYPLEIIYYQNSPFEINKTFYPNGNIKEKGLHIVSGNTYKGIWYYFDERGKLIRTINNDKIFGFSWEEVEKYMILNKIPIPLGNAHHGRHTINRFSPLLYPESSVKDVAMKSDKNAWSITWKGESFNQYYDIVLDGDTGKMLYRKKYWVKEEPGDKVPEPIIEDYRKSK